MSTNIDELRSRSMREVYQRVSESTSHPEVCLVTGELLNLALETSVYEAARMYVVSPSGIHLIDE